MGDEEYVRSTPVRDDNCRFFLGFPSVFGSWRFGFMLKHGAQGIIWLLNHLYEKIYELFISKSLLHGLWEGEMGGETL